MASEKVSSIKNDPLDTFSESDIEADFITTITQMADPTKLNASQSEVTKLDRELKMLTL